MLKRIALAALIATLPSGAWAANCSSNPFTLQNGQTADATQVMANFNNLLNCANNNLAHNGANSDITSLLGLTTPLSVSQGGAGAGTFTANSVLLGNGVSPFQTVAPASLGNVLFSSGGTWISNSPALFETGTAVAVTNTVAPTVVLTFSVPAGTLGTKRSLQLSMTGSYLNNTGAPATFQIQVEYSGVVLFDTTALSYAQSAVLRPLNLDVVLSANGGAGAQISRADFKAGGLTGLGGNGGTPLYNQIGSAVTAVDSTVAQNLSIIFTHGTASNLIIGQLSALSAVIQ